MVVFVLSAIYVRIYGIDRLVIGLGLTSYIELFFFGNKTVVILPTLIAVFAYYCLDLELDLKLAPVASLVAGGSFIIMYLSGYGGGISVGRLLAVSQIALERMLLYVAPNYANLQLNIMEYTMFTYGLHTASEFVRLFTLEQVNVNTPGFDVVNNAYNIGTFARTYYLDYGWGGFIIPPFILGLLSTWVYNWHLESPSISTTAIYSIVMTMGFMSFFANYYQYILFWWIIFVIITIDVCLGRLGYQTEYHR
jgi:oligosaccharide repeat unit polymerase